MSADLILFDHIIKLLKAIFMTYMNIPLEFLSTYCKIQTENIYISKQQIGFVCKRKQWLLNEKKCHFSCYLIP